MLVPKLRFKEFEDEWNNCKLDNIVKRIIRKNKNNESNLPLTISAQYGLVDQIIFFNKNVSSSDLSNYYLLYNGDFAYNKSYSNGYPWGAIKKLRLYDKGVVSSLYICFSINDNINSDFLEHYFESTKWYPQVSLIAVEGARNHGLLNISVDDFFNTKHYFPNTKEQGKIANFLNLLNKKIEIQKQKIEILKIYKTGLIQRLKSNSQNWTEYKIENLFALTRGHVIPKNNLKDIPNEEYKYPVYSSQTSNYGILGYDKTYDFDGKFLTWTTDGANAGKVFYRNGKFRCTNVCGLLYSSDNSSYINLLTADLLNYETPKHVSYVGNPKLMNNVMANIKVKLPSLEIQNKISNIFNIFNNKLLIEHQKLDNLNIMKKSLLQQMFI